MSGLPSVRRRLERIETDILNNFKRLGVAARTLDGKERLSQLHAVFHKMCIRDSIRTGRTDPTGMEWQYFQYD